MPGPFAQVRARVRDRAVFTVDERDLAKCIVRIVRDEFVQRLARCASLRKQVDREIVVARQRIAKCQRDAGVRAHRAVAVPADRDRITRDADTELPAARTARDDRKSHAVLPGSLRRGVANR